jgi:rhodanese-related sulfurtransferase
VLLRSRTSLRVRKTVDQLLAESRRRIEPRPGPIGAAAEVERGALIVDVRSVDERQRHGVIPGSLHVPLSVLQWRADPASGWTSPHLGDLERRVILVCAEGYSSSLAAASLEELGYGRATDLDGGFEAWRDAGLPIVQAPPPDGDGALPGMGSPVSRDEHPACGVLSRDGGGPRSGPVSNGAAPVPSTGEQNSTMT